MKLRSIHMIEQFGKIVGSVKDALAVSGTYKLALALVCLCYWVLIRKEIIPGAELWEYRASVLGVIFFGFLWVANVVMAISNFISPRDWLIHWITKRREKISAREYIPFMSDREKAIIGYLLAKNQKLFVAAHDGGHAKTLITVGIVKVALRGGQSFDLNNTPMMIPDHIWAVMVEHKDAFPSPTDMRVHPWRVSWMAT